MAIADRVYRDLPNRSNSAILNTVRCKIGTEMRGKYCLIV